MRNSLSINCFWEGITLAVYNTEFEKMFLVFGKTRQKKSSILSLVDYRISSDLQPVKSSPFVCCSQSPRFSFTHSQPPHPHLSLLPPPLLLVSSPSLLLPFPPSSYEEEVPWDGVSCNTPTSGEQEARSLKRLAKLYVLFLLSVSLSLPTFFFSVSALITFCFTQETVSSAVFLLFFLNLV